jgi:hypothetical protein
MNTKYNKPLLIIGIVCLIVAVLGDGYFGGQGLGTVVGSLTMLTAMLVCTVLSVRAERVVNAAAKKAAALKASTPASTTPIFAHVPGPGEPGYDPDDDPDDDKYWRRYYRD